MPYGKNHKARSKERILSAASDLFFRYGFDRVSINDIMKKANMTHGAFYAHFKSKEALFSATFFETLKRSRAARLVKGPLAVKHLTALVANYWNLRELEKKGKPAPENVLFNEIGSENTSIKGVFEASYNNTRKILETRLRALSRLRKLPIEHDREAIAEQARAILASLVGAVAIAKSIPHEEERGRILEATQKQILRMLGVDERELDNLPGPGGVSDW